MKKEKKYKEQAFTVSRGTAKVATSILLVIKIILIGICIWGLFRFFS